jgi:hypothetical protein
VKVTKSQISVVTLRGNEAVALEIKSEDAFPKRYTIIVGPEGNSSNQRLQLGAENFAALRDLITASDKE